MRLFSDVDINKKFFTGRTALHYACRSGHLPVVKFLIEKGRAKIEETNKNGYTPLHDAALRGHVEIVKYLLKRKKQLANVPNKFHSTPLHLALKHKRLDCARAILDLSSPDLNAKNDFGQTPLHIACQKKCEDFAIALIKQNASLLVMDDSGTTPLHLACSKGLVSAIREMLRSDSWLVRQLLCAADGSGNTCFHYASWKRSWEAVEVILQHCAAIGPETVGLSDALNVQNHDGHTCLHMCARAGQIKLCAFLLKLGVDPSLRDARRRTAFQLAPEGFLAAFQDCTGRPVSPRLLQSPPSPPHPATPYSPPSPTNDNPQLQLTALGVGNLTIL